MHIIYISDVIRETDSMNKNGPKTVSKAEYILRKSDFIRVSCEGSDGEKYAWSDSSRT